jgi:hypothetical protein
MNGKLTTPFFAGLLLLLGSFVLAHIILFFYARAQVAPLMRSGPSATDFAAPYFFVINRGAFLGLLLAFGLFGYWRLRVGLSTGAAQRLRNHEAIMRFMLLFAPLLVAIAAALTLAIYIQQLDGAFSRYNHLLQP